MVEGEHNGTLHVSTCDLAVVLGIDVYDGQNCLQAWAEFSVANLLELLNTVRNRILDFSLAIWKENPNAGETSTQSDKTIKPERVTQIFNTTVYGGTPTLVGNVTDSVLTISVMSGDFSSLERLLLQSDVAKEDIRELEAALKTDERPSLKGRFGPKVSAWISGMVKKAAEGGWGVTIGAAGKLLADAISNYYGLK